MTFGYLNRNEGYGCVNADAVDQLPKIAGVAGYNVPPQISFSDGFAQWGNSSGVNIGNVTTRPTYVLNDLVTWIKGSHTFKFGGEYRNIGGNVHSNGNQAGSFSFGRGATSILGVNSGSPIASFLLGAVDNGTVTFRTADTQYPRQHAWIFHAGDTWNATSKLTLELRPAVGLLLALEREVRPPRVLRPERRESLGRRPPGQPGVRGHRVGRGELRRALPREELVRRLGPAPRRHLRAQQQDPRPRGLGRLLRPQRSTPGGARPWTSPASTATSTSATRSAASRRRSTCRTASRRTSPRRRSSAADYRNGSSLMYRNLDGNERSRSQQWNLTVDRELSAGFTVGLAYVGSHGSRVPSSILPVNTLDPSYLSMGAALYDEFQPGQTSLDGVPVPYAGWVEQMTSCAPSVAQALRPYPQYCYTLQGVNEKQGTSDYNSLQVKLEKRFSHGTYFLVSYTFSRLYTSGADNTQSDATTWSGASGVISPYEQSRNRALAVDDVTHVLSAALVWDLPVGKGKKYVDTDGVANAILGGWQLSTIFRYSSGIPFYFRSSYCNVPGQFRAGCIPSTNGDIFAQDFGQPRRHEAGLQPERVHVAGRVQLLLRQRPADQRLPQVRLPQPGPVPHQEHEALPRREPAAAARGLQRLELAQLERRVDRVGRHRLQQRRRERGLRHVERERDRPARHPARGAHRVLTL